MKIKQALVAAQGYAVEGAAHVVAVWLTAARWVSAHPHWALLTFIAAFGIAVKF
jgi:hypothetical protein